jgi:type I restriction enzyme S subunit
MKRLAITTSGLYNLSVGKIRGICAPLPPLAEQKQIVAKVDQFMALCDDLESRLQQSHTIGENLMAAVVNQVASA